jgi:hypothetical protein
MLVGEKPTVIIRCGQPRRCVGDRCRGASGKPRTSGLKAAPPGTPIHARFHYVRLVRFLFLILIARFVIIKS